MMLKYFIPDETAMLTLGANLAKNCPKKALIYLCGDLGMGKTCLVRGFLQGLAYRGKVKSPTYTLVEIYQIAAREIYHFDLYRLTQPQELFSIGIEDYFAEETICLIEWPERGLGVLPPADLTCYIQLEEGGRLVTLTAHNSIGEHLLQKG